MTKKKNDGEKNQQNTTFITKKQYKLNKISGGFQVPQNGEQSNHLKLILKSIFVKVFIFHFDLSYTLLCWIIFVMQSDKN